MAHLSAVLLTAYSVAIALRSVASPSAMIAS
jgi:hypothetical protein